MIQFDVGLVQAARDKSLRAELADDFGVKKGLEFLRRWTHGRGYEHRRRLLSRALRITRTMSPELADVINDCRQMLGFEHPVELYVLPASDFNASCHRSAHGPTVLTVTSRLLEMFSPAELRFVIGHELGHAVYDHYGLPMPALATVSDMGVPFVSRETALKLYAWCRAAEVSADRIGLLAAGDPEAAASGFFKLASGMATDRVRPDLGAFAAQIDSLASAPEARERLRDDDDTLDCFSTHPYNPVRVRAVWAFSRSEVYLRATGQDATNALTLDQVDALVARDLRLMEPTYLGETGDDADTLRRLLYTAGLAVAAAHGAVEESELDAIAKLLGKDHSVRPDEIQTVLGDLDRRIADAQEVPLAGRAQLVQHLTIVAAADGEVQEEELLLMEDIAARLGVEARVIHQTIHGAMHPLD